MLTHRAYHMVVGVETRAGAEVGRAKINRIVIIQMRGRSPLQGLVVVCGVFLGAWLSDSSSLLASKELL